MKGEGLDPYEGLRDARNGRAALALAVDIARDLAQWPLKREGRQGTAFEGFEAKELRAGEEIATRLDDLRDLPEVEPRREDIPSLVESMTVPLWSGPAAGRVRVASPYRLRAARFPTVFVLALEDGSFPRHGGGEPFLSDDQRVAVGLPERIEPELEERYLFSICLSLPTDRLYPQPPRLRRGRRAPLPLSLPRRGPRAARPAAPAPRRPRPAGGSDRPEARPRRGRIPARRRAERGRARPRPRGDPRPRDRAPRRPRHRRRHRRARRRAPRRRPRL